MNWFSKFLTSSLGQKLIMSLTGLFLVTFLIVHLAGNLQLLSNDGQAFNEYAYFMTHNPLIKTVAYGNYFFILLHAIQGLMLWSKNRAAKGQGYKVNNTRAVGTAAGAAKNMAYLGMLILVFIIIHMGDFWWAMKMGETPMASYDGVQIKDLYTKVYASFKQLWIVVFYLIAMIGLALHLRHGFWSSFQTLGLNHKKYTPFIRFVGMAIAILIPLGFAIIPLYTYFVMPELASYPQEFANGGYFWGIKW